MFGDHSLRVVHAAVAYFDCVPVKDLVESAWFRKMFVN